MVLELLINPKKVIGKPWEMVALGFVYAFIAAFLALWIFKNYVSIVMITLTIVASIPLVHNIIKSEEKKDFAIGDEKRLLKEHSRVVFALLYLFLGFVLAYMGLYIFLPSTMVERLFSAQLETIITVKSVATGSYISLFGAFTAIFLNNLKILLFCLAFSFFYGAGAIFILTWNASVMATAIGSFIRNNLFYATGIFDYFQVTMVGMLQYLLHGVPEIIAYFIGALASGMMSFALINHDFMSPNFKRVLKDVGGLVAIAVGVLLVAALIEVFITPLLM